MNRFKWCSILLLLSVLVWGGVATSATLTVPVPYATIQAAVDEAAPTDIILVSAGTYEEQIEITKTLTLDGGGGGGAVIIKSPVTLTKYFQPGSLKNYPVVYVHDCDGVTVKNLTVDGAGRGNTNYRFQGIGFWNAGGTVDHCVVKDIKDTPFSGAQHGVAIYSYSSGTTAYALNVWDCDIYGFQKNAMALNAGDTNPFTVDVRRNVVTGAGATGVTAQNGIQVWADLGTGTVADNTVSGIGYTGSSYVASSILNYYADVDITGNTITGGNMGIYNIDGAGEISGNDLTIEKLGGYAAGILAMDPPRAVPSPFGAAESGGPSGVAGISLSSAALLDVDVSGNTVVFSGTDNTNTYGIEFDAGYSANDLAVTANENTVTGFDYGFGFWQCESGCDPSPGEFTSITATGNSIVGNLSYGMASNVDYVDVDATDNWWGDATGPTHSSNPGGTGDAVSDYVLYGSWLTGTNEISLVPSYDNTCGTPLWYTFRIERAGAPEEVRGYDVKFQINTAVVKIATLTTADVVERNYLDTFGNGQFFCVDNGGGVYTASGAIIGGSVGATGNGDLFKVRLTPVAPGTSAIAIDPLKLKLRDLNNQPLPIVGVDGSVQVECDPPTMEAIVPLGGGCYNTPPVFSNFGFDDNVNLDLAEYKIDSGSWTTIFSFFDGASWDSDGWVLPGFSGLLDGSRTVYFRVKDDAGNWNGEGTPDTYSWSFVKDMVAPAAPTNFVALPGHNKVHLTWTNPTGDTSFEGVEIRVKGWPDYPHYASTPLGYPTGPTDGTPVVLTDAQTYTDDPRTPRDIYYYTAFSKDCAGNFSEAVSGTMDRSTSYWLGDIDPDMTPGPPGDGLIGMGDLPAFSNVFGEIEGGTYWNAEADFGPTDDWSRFGIPKPDNVVDFEDLMIFAMNYGNVTAEGTSGALLALTESVPLGEQVSFQLVLISREDGKATYAVIMENQAEVLKGFSLKVAYGAGNSLEGVTASREMTGKGSQHFFGVIERESGVVEICVAALGVNSPFEYTGEVARVVVRETTESAAQLRTVDLRDINNGRDEVTLPGTGVETPYIPVTTALLQNHPNPFNPSTTIAFDVATAGEVRIEIYDVSGALVRTLVNGENGVGRHVATWDGRDGVGNQVHTGVYFYRMTAPGYTSQAKKMLLLK